MTDTRNLLAAILALTALLGSPPPKTAGEELGNDLQRLVDEAKPEAVVAIPPGIYRDAITIDKPLTLKGESLEECVLELTADEPAIQISSNAPVVVDSITIKWQLATSEHHKAPPCAVSVKDGNATIRNCRVVALGNFKRSPSAVLAQGFSNVKLEKCRFEGFEFTVFYSGGAEGSITDCVILNPGHCGASVHNGSKIDFARNIVAGAEYHGLRCTGGTLLAHDNLIINNKNRGIYLGNKNAHGKVSNNVIMGNGTGISAFAQTDVTIENNVILNSSYAGLGTRDSCPLTVRNNIFQANTRGIVVFKEAGKPQVNFKQNSFWKNEEDTENVDTPADSIMANPQFTASDRGDFTPQAVELRAHKQGLSDSSVIRDLWQKWETVSQKK